MKKLATIAIALFAAIGAFAQPEAGTFSLTPRVGFNMSNLTGNVYDATYTMVDGKTTVEGDLHAGFAVGVDAGYQVSKHFALSAGVVYSYQGSARGYSTKIGSSEGKTAYEFKDKSKLNMSYLQIPILANVYLFKGFAVKAGIQPGFLLAAKDKENITSTASKGSNSTADVKSDFKTFDFAIPVGVSYEFANGLMIDARYNIGLTDVVKSGTALAKADKSGKTSVIQISLGYKFKL